MAHRSILKKKANKLRKAMRRQLPARIDLVEFLISRHHAQTTGQAEAIILAGRVKSESHVLGIKQVTRLKPLSRLQTLAGTEPSTATEEVDVVDRLVDASLRKTIAVTA